MGFSKLLLWYIAQKDPAGRSMAELQRRPSNRNPLHPQTQVLDEGLFLEINLLRQELCRTEI